MWQTDTIEQMEATAKSEFDQNCNRKIRGEWLEVIWVNVTIIHHFEYKWGKNFVSREVAKRVLDSTD